jgi:hypothetical protein
MFARSGSVTQVPVAALLLALAGCGGGTVDGNTATTVGPTPEELTEKDTAAIQALRVTVALPEDTSTMTVANPCVDGAKETCNAIDDNCNGVIDEDCGYGTGTMQITMGWNTKADMDLFVTDPRGETISNQHRRSAAGGEIDQESRGSCRADQKVNQVENARFAGVPLKGKYTVAAQYWGECGEGGTTTVSITLAFGGKVVGIYNRPLEPGDKPTVFTFNVE